MKRFQPIHDIAEICARRGLHQAVLSPGSRCAPLTLAFVRHHNIKTRTFSDERSAAFIALGIAQQTHLPTVLLCTSGTAAYNFAPAVAEAFFSETPLIIFSADRPSEWIAQHDGQTIYQTEIFGRHVKKSFQLPQEYEHPDSVWAINRIVNEAISISLQQPQGPVHINAPFREPLYPTADDTITFSNDVRTIEIVPPKLSLDDTQYYILQQELNNYQRILIAGGQNEYEPGLLHSLNDFSSAYNIPVVGDIIANLHPLEKLIRHSDIFLSQATTEIKKALQPDLLITFGKSVISKNLKLFLRAYKPKAHWHIQPAGTPADTFQSITKAIPSDPALFFYSLHEIKTKTFDDRHDTNYHELWQEEEHRALQVLSGFFPQTGITELELVKEALQQLPKNSNLHLANSMSVRYANFIGLTSDQKNIDVFANRGTSGIDGCTSTVVGHSLMSDRLNILITGDLAFFYDRNAFWHNYQLPNLRVIVLNNHGGIIFGMIDGPSALPEANEYFITQQKLNAKKLCEEFGFDYLKPGGKNDVRKLLNAFFQADGKTKILELETDVTINKEVFNNLKQKIKHSYEF